MPHLHLPTRTGPQALARSLAWLRLFAIGGQSLAVLTVSLWLGLAIPRQELFIGIAALAVFAIIAAWRLQRPWPVREWEAVIHIGVDTLVLSYLLYLTGGASNAFVSLLLVPIALSAAAMSMRGVAIVAGLSALAYLVLLVHSIPLPTPDMTDPDGFRLHVVGMAVNFVIMALILGVFIRRVASALHAQQAEVQRIRERALRDEGILAIATQAASAAHAMNTPLSTMRTLLPELRHDYAAQQQLTEDLTLLESQVDRCRASLREMVAFGKSQLSQEPEQTTLAAFLHACLERFRLLRPEADVDYALDAAIGSTQLTIQAGLRHALINLLNNAADASAQRDSRAVALRAQLDDGWLELTVADRGPGFIDTEDLAELGRSNKYGGLGLGLALAEATAERLAGELSVTNTGRGGEIHLRLPLDIRPRS